MRFTIECLEDHLSPVVGSFADAPLQATGSFYDGVVRIETTGGLGTGGLFNTGVGKGYGHHILTAAHGTPAKDAVNSNYILNRDSGSVSKYLY